MELRERKETDSFLSAVERLMDQITTEVILEQNLQEQAELPSFVLHLLKTYGDKVHCGFLSGSQMRK